MTQTQYIDGKGRRRRGAPPDPVLEDPISAEDAVLGTALDTLGIDASPEDVKPKPKSARKPAAKSKPATKEAKVPAKSTTTKRGRKQGVTYAPPTIIGMADEAPPKAAASIYAPLLQEIVKMNAKSPKKYVQINPSNRSAASLKNSLSTAAKKLKIELDMSVGIVDGTEIVYVRVGS